MTNSKEKNEDDGVGHGQEESSLVLETETQTPTPAQDQNQPRDEQKTAVSPTHTPLPLPLPLPPKTEASEVPLHQPGDEPVSKSSSDMKPEPGNGNGNGVLIAEPTSKHAFLLDQHMYEGNESGTEEDQSNFMKELENFFRERAMEFKPPKFYGEGLNCLKLWRAVTKLGGYDKVTTCKLWRQVGESFKPPKTCTTVSWTFRGFYEKALLDYERHKTSGGELNIPVSSHAEPVIVDTQASGSGRARRDAAARAMQGWHSQRLLGNGEVSDPIIKDKSSISMQKREKQLKNIGLLKRKKPPYTDHVVKAARTKASKSQLRFMLDIAVVDAGPPAEWVKINVQRTKDCFEVYALVPGLLREEVRVQSDPAGRLVISGEPEHADNPWGVTPFKKVVSLPSRIDPHQTSAVVTLHGQLFIRVPFELSE
ncbi:hypothetical protein G4B88_006953 [Cannabis sativa]|uniref:AT-rich interactive domain-containing protein 3 n=1 Tax=Cannabis sativa TaxID=3483 RepID=A0A7J6G3U2_CANSA|nr:hypothetical protein G4B88_006953 [Cannabis sativa]